MMYAYTESFITAIPTTRWCTARARCWTRCPGDAWQPFANVRSLLAYMWTRPGKQLMFMGNEFAQHNEWSDTRG